MRDSEILRRAYGHLFDMVIVNNDIEETISILETTMEKIHSQPQWVPVSIANYFCYVSQGFINPML